MSVQLSVTIFLMGVVSALFMLPFKIRFAKRDPINHVISRAIWVVALAFSAFTVTVITTMADGAAIGVTKEMLTMVWFFHKALYVATLALMVSTVFSYLSLLDKEKKAKRMGDE